MIFQKREFLYYIKNWRLIFFRKCMIISSFTQPKDVFLWVRKCGPHGKLTFLLFQLSATLKKSPNWKASKIGSFIFSWYLYLTNLMPYANTNTNYLLSLVITIASPTWYIYDVSWCEFFGFYSLYTFVVLPNDFSNLGFILF